MLRNILGKFKIKGFSPIWQLLLSPEKLCYKWGLLSTAKLQLPDFIGIGAPQSGTTWLYENLKAHPELYLSRKKEIHYFDRNYHLPLCWYARHFEKGKGLKKGEITPGYSILNLQQIKTIKRLMPDVKIIYLLRHPYEQRASGLRRKIGQYKKAHGKYPAAEIIKEYIYAKSNLPGNYDPDLRKSDYAQVLKNWYKVFDADNIFIGNFEEIKSQPKQFLIALFEFLKVDVPTDWDAFKLEEKINSNPNYELDEEYQNMIRNLVADDLKELKDLIPGKFDHWN